MKNPFKATPEAEEPLRQFPEGRPSYSKLQPPPTDRDRLRETLKTLDRLNCEYEIIYDNIKYTRKLNEHESH